MTADTPTSTLTNPRKLTGKTILYVEDNKEVSTACQRMMKIHGAKVVAASSPAQALAAFRTVVFDAVLTDWDLGHGETGEPVILRAQELGVPVLLMTGDDSPARERGITCPIILKGSSGWIDELARLTTKP